MAWIRSHRAVSWTVVIALVAAVPVTFGALHRGYPVSDVQLAARNVWVTNAAEAEVGNLSRQIDQLTSATTVTGSAFDVLQNPTGLFVQNTTDGTLKRVDPSYATFLESATLPSGAVTAYGGDTISVLGADGSLWTMPSTGTLVTDIASSTPVAKLGAGSKAVVGADGTVYAASRSGDLVAVDPTTKHVTHHSVGSLGVFDLTVVGSTPVMLDESSDSLVLENGSRVKLTAQALQVQQPSPASDHVLVATGTGLVRVDLSSHRQTAISAGIGSAVTRAQTAAPVQVAGCDHGAWSSALKYAYACGSRTRAFDLPQSDSGDTLVFRVNGTVVALNDVANGDSWLVDSTLHLVNNWADVAPPKQSIAGTKHSKQSAVSLQEEPWTPSASNRPPVAVDDVLGARPGVSTVLPVLANDSDPDGDVLTISHVDAIPASFGTVQLIDGDRSLQFTPAPGVTTGEVNFGYTAFDGHPSNGTASATVHLTIHPLTQPDNAPKALNDSATLVDQGQSVSYDVLSDWQDPDGDPMQLVSASVSTGDIVHTTPDGYVNFTSVSAQLGVKKVVFTVADDYGKTASGTLEVDVKAASTQAPIAVQDLASGFAGDYITVDPLDNDLSPSGQTLKLGTVTALGSPQITFQTNPATGTLQATAPDPGTYFLEYTVSAGAGPSSKGLIRIDVLPAPKTHLPPVAVADVAYVIGTGNPVTVPVLDNDVSPQGLVLGVQSIQVPPTSAALRVELLNNTEIRITATTPLTAPLPVTYTVSDGTQTSKATVTVVPVTIPSAHQAPVTKDDDITVRAGAVATVPVLDNDYDPAGASMALAPTLVSSGSGGLAFVSGNDVRYQAPSTPGQYTLTYKVVDSAGESAAANVVATVIAPDAATDRAPDPVPVVARVFSGAEVRVPLPLDGIDPDGDTVTLVGTSGTPQLGRVVDTGPGYFDYQASAGASGTDTFQYRVADSYGKIGVASVRVGVIPRAGIMAPTAVDADIAMKPDRVASVAVLVADSDPNGYAIHVADGSVKVLKAGVTASIVDNQVVVKSGSASGKYNVSYGITDGHSSVVATAFIHVTVGPQSPEEPPVAVDHDLTTAQVNGKTSVKVDPRVDAQDTGGLVSALAVSLVGPNASKASMAPDGTITVTPAATSTAIGYRLTNSTDKLSATAFIVVPPKPAPKSEQPPYLKRNITASLLQVASNTTKQWKLSQLVSDPSGRPVTLVGYPTATNNNGSSVRADSTTLTFTSAKDYGGHAAIQFDVTDGKNQASLTLDITVIAPKPQPVAPTFTSATVNVAQGGKASVDLRNYSYDPDQKLVDDASYSVSGGSGAVTASSAGSRGGTVTVSAAVDAKRGSVVTFPITMRSGTFTVTGTVKATVVSSTKPLAQAITDTAKVVRSHSVTINALANDVDPFSTPLTIVKAVLVPSASRATVTFAGSTVTYTADPGFIGDATIKYTVEDQTHDPAREVVGQIVVTVQDVPDQMAAPIVQGASNGTAPIQFQAPPSVNGSSVTSYTVASSPATTPPTNCVPGAPCLFSNLTNGVAYTFSVFATNGIGPSTVSAASSPSVTPYAIPGTATFVNELASGYAPATLGANWIAPSDQGGGGVYYKWSISGPADYSGTTSGTSVTASTTAPAGSYRASVSACNSAGCSAAASSNPIIISSPPQPSISLVHGGTVTSGGNPSCSASAPCQYIGFNVTNLPAGSYKVLVYVDSDPSFPGTPYNGGSVSNSGTTITNDRVGRNQYYVKVTITGLPGGDISATSGAKWTF